MLSMDVSTKQYVKNNEAEETNNIQDVPDRRDIKLKEAEKTIANKDVIIRMLQEQVKKLEESYKRNMNETEAFRYKFCVASEQIKKLRGICPRNKEKQIKELKHDLMKWKQECDQLPTMKDRCPALAGKQTYIQQIRNIENVVKAQYELLQTLVEKMSLKDNSPQIQPQKTESIDKNSDTVKLKKEIDRLQNENDKLQEQLTEFHRETYLPKRTDSLIKTYKKTKEHLEEKLSKISQMNVDIKSDDDDEDNLSANELRSVGFSKQKLIIESDEITDIGDNDESIQNIDETRTNGLEEKPVVNETENADGSNTASLNKKQHSGDLSAHSSECAIKTYKAPSERTQEISDQQNNENELPRTGSTGDNIPTEKQETAMCCCEPGSSQETNSVPQKNNYLRCYCEAALKDKVNAIKQGQLLSASVAQNSNISPPDVNYLKTEIQDKSSVCAEIDESKNVKLDAEFWNKFNEISETVSKLVQKQADTCENLELLKNEIAVSHASCVQNISQECKAATDNIVQVNDKIHQELGDLKTKIEELLTKTEILNCNCDQKTRKLECNLETCSFTNEKPPEVAADVQNDIITTEPIIADDQPAEEEITPSPNETDDEEKDLPTDNNMEQLEQEYDNLVKEEEQKNETIHCMKGLISYCKDLRENIEARHPHISNEIQGETPNECECKKGNVCSYIEKARCENFKLKETISSVLDHLNNKIKTLKGDKENCSFCLCSECSSPVRTATVSNTGSNVANSCAEETDVQSELEIEDIYKVVRRTFQPNKGTQSSTCCFCSKEKIVPHTHASPQAQTKPQEIGEIEEIYNSVLCACASKINNNQYAPSVRQKCTSKQCTSIPCCNVGSNTSSLSKSSLTTNLQQYIYYLHEQLDVISNIENQIHDLRQDVANPAN